VAASALALTACGGSSTPTGHPTSPGGSGSNIFPSDGPASSPATTSSPTPTIPGLSALSACAGPAATPAASGPLVAVAVNQIPAQTVEIVDGSGRVVNQTQTDVSAGPFPVGVGPSGVLLYDQGTGGVELLAPSGALQDLGTTAPGQGIASTTAAAESPSGDCWILSLATWSQTSSANPVATTTLYVIAPGGAVSTALTLTRANQVNGAWAGGYRVMAWTAQGVLLGSSPTGVGGVGPFIIEDYSLATVVNLDAQTGNLSAPLCPVGTGDRFGDLASDRSVACVSGEGGDAKITVTGPTGSRATVNTEAPYAGQVAFVGGTSTLTFSTSLGAVEGGGAWYDNLAVANLSQPSAAPVNVRSGDDANWDEQGFAFDKLVGSSTIAELGPASPGSTATVLMLINLSTAQPTTLAPADTILGVL
jgi:hypothetical protein